LLATAGRCQLIELVHSITKSSAIWRVTNHHKLLKKCVSSAPIISANTNYGWPV